MSKSSTHTCPTCKGVLSLHMDDDHVYSMTCECGKRFSQSVTQILDVSARAPFSAAAWFGQTVGVEGVQRLVRDREIHATALPTISLAQITAKLTASKLTVNHRRDERGASGTGIHKALEDYANDGTIPRVEGFPAADRVRLRALADFLVTYRPSFRATEVQVVSVKHRFAGTFDFLADIFGEVYYDAKLKRPAFRPASTSLFTLGDLKTAKYVYPAKNFTQLEAYEGARVEAGETPTDVRAVLWLGPRGEMELVPSSASFEDFLTLRGAAEVLTRLEASYKRPRAAR